MGDSAARYTCFFKRIPTPCRVERKADGALLFPFSVTSLHFLQDMAVPWTQERKVIRVAVPRKEVVNALVHYELGDALVGDDRFCNSAQYLSNLLASCVENTSWGDVETMASDLHPEYAWCLLDSLMRFIHYKKWQRPYVLKQVPQVLLTWFLGQEMRLMRLKRLLTALHSILVRHKLVLQ